MSLSDRVAIVTGSSRGLGKAIALTFAKAGATVVVAARTEQPHPRIAGTIHQTVAEIEAAGGVAIPFQCNVASAEEIDMMGRHVLERLGHVDILVHNAAANFPGGVADNDLRRWDILMNVNVRALFCLARAVLPSMQSRGWGHIISVSPKLDLNSQGGPYIQSKQSATRLALSMAGEFAKHGIAVNCLWPEGLRRTEGTTLMGMSAPVVYSPQLFADAALSIVTKDPRTSTGRTVLDTEVLRDDGVTNVSKYRL